MFASHSGSSRVQTPLIPKQEHDHANDSADEPQEHIDQVDPDGVFHSLDPAIALRVLVNVEFTEDTEDGCPEDTAPGKSTD